MQTRKSKRSVGKTKTEWEKSLNLCRVIPATSASTVSDLNQKIYGKIDEWRLRPLVGDFPYVLLDGLWLKRW